MPAQAAHNQCRYTTLQYKRKQRKRPKVLELVRQEPSKRLKQQREQRDSIHKHQRHTLGVRQAINHTKWERPRRRTEEMPAHIVLVYITAAAKNPGYVGWVNNTRAKER